MSESLEITSHLAHLNSEVERLDNDIQRIANKLKSEGFVTRVPAAMIENEQKKLAQFECQKSDIEEQIRSATE